MLVFGGKQIKHRCQGWGREEDPWWARSWDPVLYSKQLEARFDSQCFNERLYLARTVVFGGHRQAFT